jgi:hypothetical protein
MVGLRKRYVRQKEKEKEERRKEEMICHLADIHQHLLYYNE